VRLIQLAGYDGPYRGSFVPMLQSALTTARREGWRAELVLPDHVRDRDWVNDFEREGIDLRFVSTDSRVRLRREIAALVRASNEPTVLHTSFTSFDVAAALAGRRRDDVAVFWHMQSRLNAGPVVTARNIARFSVLGRMVHRILCVAPDVVDAVRGRGAPRDKVMLWPNAIDLARFPPVDETRRRVARERLGVPADANVLLHFGWDWDRKGGDIFAAAVEHLRQTDPRAIGISVGGGAQAEACRLELGLAPEVLRVLDPLDDVQLLHAAADVFVASSRGEGMPFAMAEALASGVPVVATRIPGHEALGEGLRACVLTSLDPAEVAAGVRSLLGRGAAAAALDANDARAQLSERHSLDAWSERLLSLYEEILTDGVTDTPVRAGAGA
jgi:glycosyltransferase involved in cell wall biosynthesis